MKILLTSLLLVSTACFSQQQEAIDDELRESIIKIDVTVTDLFSRTETMPLVITTFRPPGEGKHPLLILNHGRSKESERHKPKRQRLWAQARWFVEQGFVVMVPTRIGYGETYSSFDPEYSNACRGVNLRYKDDALFTQIMATVEFSKSLSYVDTTAWLIAGQSLGGYTAMTIARRSPDGLIGAINFSGGYGGDPDNRRGNSCGAYAWEIELKDKKMERKVPTLWIYWKNDWYWGNATPQDWFKAYKSSGALGNFFHLNEINGDGHRGFSRDGKNWSQVVKPFINSLSLQLQSVHLRKPKYSAPPSGFAKINDINQIPFLNEVGRESYKTFLEKSHPKAFAINVDGKWGWSNGHWDSNDRALNYCNKNAKTPCTLYAIDEDVVWTNKIQ
jgi:dienelactone hydrolase